MTAIDVTCTDQDYWEEILAENDLSQDREKPEDFGVLEPIIKSLNRKNSGIREETDAELKAKLDGDDLFFRGHRIVRVRHGSRKCPDWVLDNDQIKKLLLTSFPKLGSDDKQRARAGRWARIIQLYHRSQLTQGQTAKELGISLSTLKMAVKAINRVSRGLNAAGRPRYKKTYSPSRHTIDRD